MLFGNSNVDHCSRAHRYSHDIPHSITHFLSRFLLISEHINRAPSCLVDSALINDATLNVNQDCMAL